MGDFNSASLWMKLCVILISLSMLTDMFAHATGVAQGWTSVEACFIIGYICVLVALILVYGYVFMDELKGNKPCLICIIIFALIGGIAIIIGLAMWGGNAGRSCTKNVCTGVSVYAGNMAGWAGLMAILAGIFAILDIAGVKGK